MCLIMVLVIYPAFSLIKNLSQQPMVLDNFNTLFRVYFNVYFLRSLNIVILTNLSNYTIPPSPAQCPSWRNV